MNKPILKWVGGKTQILDNIIGQFPNNINNYHEIFLGGGSVLFGLLEKIKTNQITLTGTINAYDVNEPLIFVYKNIQICPDALYDEIKMIIDEFNNCADTGTINRKPTTIEIAKENKENYYYWIRCKYNSLSPEDKTTAKGSAMFIFLNKTCFRGVFRVGPNGFNVPYGHYTNPEIINREHLNNVCELIRPVIFRCCDFKVSLANICENDFVYLDPPYAPEKATSFVSYTLNGFNMENHLSLFTTLHSLTVQNKKWLLSNADVKLIRDSFTEDKYNIVSISCKRSINSKNPGSKTNEVIISQK